MLENSSQTIANFVATAIMMALGIAMGCVSRIGYHAILVKEKSLFLRELPDLDAHAKCKSVFQEDQLVSFCCLDYSIGRIACGYPRKFDCFLL